MTRPRGTVSSVDALGVAISDTKARAAALEVVAHDHPGRLSGVILCTSSTLPSPLYEGLVVYETDTNRIRIYDGTQWVTMLETGQPPGLQKINDVTATFVGGTAGTVSDGVVTFGTNNTGVTVTCFSAQFDNYKIIAHGGTGSASSNGNMYLGSVAPANGYYQGRAVVAYATAAQTLLSDNNAAAWSNLFNLHIYGLYGNIDLFSPFLAQRAAFSATRGGMSTDNFGGWGGGMHNSTTSFTSFTITWPSASLTGGTLRVYGYRN